LIKPADLAQFFEKIWYEKVGLSVALALTNVFVISLSATSKASLATTLSVLLPANLVIFALWWWSRLPPKTSKNKIGFLISIACSDDKEAQKLQEDFIEPLRQLIKSGKTGHAFHFMVLPQVLAKTLVDTEAAVSMRLRSRAQFMLYGRVKIRMLNGEDHHVIDLEGMVAHSPIPNDVQAVLAKEFAELLPRRVHLSTVNDLFTFQFTSEWAELVARYVIGIAAGLSGDLDYAEALFNEARQRLRNKDRSFPVYRKLSERIPLRISELCLSRIDQTMQKWVNTRSPELLDKIEIEIDKLHDSYSNVENVLYTKTILAFVKRRDTRAAFALLRHVPNRDTALWHLNAAFLRAYDGNLKSAIRHYRRAALLEPESDTISQVEDFMVWVLRQESEKDQLHYCLGFFNWHIKGDDIQAKNDLATFINSQGAARFSEEKRLAQAWIQTIESAPRVSMADPR
jgi:hypothetical protein